MFFLQSIKEKRIIPVMKHGTEDMIQKQNHTVDLIILFSGFHKLYLL